MTKISATIVADSINEFGDRITSMELVFPRFILAELNTHRAFCVSGDTMLEFDLPTPATTSNDFKSYRISIKEFVEKWQHGIKPRKRHSYEVALENKVYTAKEIALITGKGASNIRGVCRSGICRVLNPNKKRGEDFQINGFDYNEYHNGVERKNNALYRYKRMRIRILNESTGLVEHSTVEDAFYSGRKKVFKVSTESGKHIKLTGEHRIMTEGGWKMQKDLNVGDYIISQKFGLRPKDKSSYQRVFNGRWVSEFLRKAKPEIKLKQEGICEKCKESPVEDLHHIIPVYKDPSKAFEINNLVGLCKKCHKEEHKNQDWQVSEYLYGAPDKIVSIEELEEEDVYDISIKGKYHNFIANGIVVHNCKNSASSRAIPFSKMVEMVEQDPFIPIAWQKEHKGMQGTEYWDKDSVQIEDEAGGTPVVDWLKSTWLLSRDYAVGMATTLNKSGATKQLCNRLLEPFMWHKVLLTATDFENFFNLRCPAYKLMTPVTKTDRLFRSRKDVIKARSEFWDTEGKKNFDDYSEVDWLKLNTGQAEIHMMALAEAMYDAMQESSPKLLLAGEWHIPYRDKINICELEAELGVSIPLEQSESAIIQIATGMAARVSYTAVGNEKDKPYSSLIGIHDKMKTAVPFHASPFEHSARAMTNHEYWNYSFTKPPKEIPEPRESDFGRCKNFKGFIQYREILEKTLINNK
jgi:hypothetical protein